MSRLPAFLPLLWLIGCGPPSPPATHLASFMDGVHSSTGFSGAVVVERWGELLFEGGWGFADREAGHPLTPDTPADAGSIAKTFVAATIWDLVREGRIGLDDPVREYIPSFPHEETTIGHLLDHSAGIPELADPTGLSNADIVNAINPTPTFQPGSRFSYCNECFDILALVIEGVTHGYWGDHLKARYFEPFQMDSAFIRPAMFADWQGVRTRSYRLSGVEVVDHDVHDNEPFYGSSNLYLSARDLARWGSAFVHGKVLGRSVMEVAEQRTRFRDGSQSALNRLNWFQRDPGGAAYFDGHLRGFHCVVYWDAKSGLVIAWVSNILGGRPVELQLTRELVRIAQGGPPVNVPDFPKRLEGSDGAAMEGRFAVPGVGAVSVKPRDGIVQVSVEGGPSHPGYPSTGYYVPNLGVELGFSGMEGERYARLHWLSVFEHRSGERLDR